MVKLFQIFAVILIVAAAFFFLKEDYDNAFITGVLSASSFFLSLRFIYKPRVTERDQERLGSADEDDLITADDEMRPVENIKN
jgi:hypothetical protein